MNVAGYGKQNAVLRKIGDFPPEFRPEIDAILGSLYQQGLLFKAIVEMYLKRTINTTQYLFVGIMGMVGPDYLGARDILHKKNPLDIIPWYMFPGLANKDMTPAILEVLEFNKL